MTSFTDMAGDSEGALVIPIVLFTLTVLGGTFYIVTWLTRRSKEISKVSSKAQIKEHTTKTKSVPKEKNNKKKAAPVPKRSAPPGQHKFDHDHLIASLKGHTGQLTGGEFSPNGKNFLTSAEVARAYPCVPQVQKDKGCKQFKAVNHNEDNGGWATNSLSSSNTPSDTEDSLTSSSSSGSKMSRRQKKNKRKKKNMKWDEKLLKHSSGSVSQKNTKAFEQLCYSGMQEPDVHNVLLRLCVNVQDRVLNGYPYQTYLGTYVFKSLGFSCIEAVLGEHRLVQAEIQDSEKCEDVHREDESSATNFIRARDNNPADFNSFKLDYRNCMRCRQFFNLSENGSSLCFYHPRKAVLSAAGEVRYTCCNLMKNNSGCFVSKYHVFHHLSLGLNGPLTGYISTQATERAPKVFGLDCEMVFTSQGFEVARATLVNVCGETVLDTFITPQGQIYDLNTIFSGITDEKLVCAIPFQKAQSLILDSLKSCDILVGHSLDGDLNVLKIIHRRVVDSSLLFKAMPNTDASGGSPLPHRVALKSLVKEHLGQDIQKGGDRGHNSVEDATAALNLVLNQVCGEASRRDPRRSKIAPLPPMLHAITA